MTPLIPSSTRQVTDEEEGKQRFTVERGLLLHFPHFLVTLFFVFPFPVNEPWVQALADCYFGVGFNHVLVNSGCVRIVDCEVLRKKIRRMHWKVWGNAFCELNSQDKCWINRSHLGEMQLPFIPGFSFSPLMCLKRPVESLFILKPGRRTVNEQRMDCAQKCTLEGTFDVSNKFTKEPLDFKDHCCQISVLWNKC